MRELHPHPLPYAAGYNLDLYCKYISTEHGFDGMSASFFASDKKQAFQNAKKAGWVIHPDRTSTCPRCTLRKAHRP